MNPPIEIVDAFTSQPFAGNPAAVCFLDRDAADQWRQNVAAEMNLSETAFLRQIETGFELRWFTPTVEVDLCGHATLASAHAIWRRNLVAAESAIAFHTRSGTLTCTRDGEWIQLDFPSLPPEPCQTPPSLFAALGIDNAVAVVRSKYDFLVEVASAEIVREISPDFQKLREIDARGVIVTASSDNPDEVDFVSRFFAPRCGVNEDPVCGSAHCVLCPYWSSKSGKLTLIGHQISRRGGIIRVTLNGDRVLIGGHATTVLVGALTTTELA
ncbi:MAG TPA: PhzF family phenazine biosynthesis protein [Planctomycetaceae bacterium]|nr:PhzF family phenazine biosynthesis protein [Planctomycetaceae bacterium]